MFPFLSGWITHFEFFLQTKWANSENMAHNVSVPIRIEKKKKQENLSLEEVNIKSSIPLLYMREVKAKFTHNLILMCELFNSEK